MRAVAVTSLTVAQLVDIELDEKVDSAVDDWGKPRSEGGPRSRMWMYARVLAAGNGVKTEDVTGLSLDELMDKVTLNDPTPPASARPS